MNRRYLLSSSAALVGALLLGLGPALPGEAQNNPGGGNAGAVGAPGGQGGFAGQGRRFLGPQNGQNLAQSAIATLIKRNDVRSELLVTSTQREQLAAMETFTQNEMAQKLQALQTQNLSPQELQNMTPEERQARSQERMQQGQGIMQAYQGDLEKRIAQILTSRATAGVAQIDRLYQLDLQWRGPLALTEKRVADAFPLTPDQREKIQTILQEYQTAGMEAMQKHLGDIRTLLGTGANNGAPPDRNTLQQEMKRRMDAAQSETEKAKKAAASKILALLTPEQQQKWQDLQGHKFTFRTNP